MRKRVTLIIFSCIIFFLTVLTSCLRVESLPILTEQDAKLVIDLHLAAAEKYVEFRQQDPNPAERTVSWIRSKTGVEDAGVSEDGSIWILYSCGVEGVIYTYSTDKSFFAVGRSTLLPKTVDPVVGNTRSLLLGGKQRVVVSPQKKSAVILLPFQEHLKERAAGIIRAHLESIGYKVNEYRDEMVTIEVLESLGNFGVIYITTHGGVGRKSVNIMSGEKVTLRKLIRYWRPGKGIGIGTFAGSRESYFTIDKHFIERYNYHNSLIYINACSSLFNTTLADAFLRKGAAIYFGWTERTYVMEWFTETAAQAIFELAVQPSFSIEIAYNTPTIDVTATERPGRYSINDLYPLKLYKNEDQDNNVNICFANAGCIWSDPGENTLWYELDFKYIKRPDVICFVLNPVDYLPVPYVVVREGMPWLQAKQYAEAMGGHLVTIHSEAENKLVVDLARAEGVQGSFWIGITDEVNEGHFVWVTGEPVTYTNWGPGNPNNYPWGPEGEDYGEIGWYSDNPYLWNDRDGRDPLPFVVEFERVP